MWKKIIFGASLTLGLGLFIFFIQKFGGITKAIEVVGQVGVAGLSVFLLNASFTLLVPAVGWYLLLRGEGMKVPLWTTMKANLMGFPVNFVAPSLFLGAEPLKMFYVSNLHGVPKRRILATVIVAKLQELGALILVMLVAGVVTIWRVPMDKKTSVILMVSMLAVCAVFVLMLLAFIGNWKPSVKVVNLIAGFGSKALKRRRKLAKLRSHAREMEYIVRRYFTHHWKIFVAAQLITLLSAVSILMRPWIFFYFGQGKMLGMEHLCAIYVVTNLINIVPHTPGALGIFEGGMVALFALLNLDKNHAPAFSLVNRFADITLILVGVWMIVHYNLQAVAKKLAKGEVKPTPVVAVHDADADQYSQELDSKLTDQIVLPKLPERKKKD